MVFVYVAVVVVVEGNIEKEVMWHMKRLPLVVIETGE